MIMDQIINLHDFPATTLKKRLELAEREYPGMRILYVGRPQDGFPAIPSPLRNTVYLSRQDERDMKKRLANIAAYKKALWEKIRAGDKAVMDELASIDENTILACWCNPLPCHSQVIWAAWHYVKSKERVRLVQTA
jgi:hypothetical protein